MNNYGIYNRFFDDTHKLGDLIDVRGKYLYIHKYSRSLNLFVVNYLEFSNCI